MKVSTVIILLGLVGQIRWANPNSEALNIFTVVCASVQIFLIIVFGGRWLMRRLWP